MSSNSDIAISVRGLSKKYSIAHQGPKATTAAEAVASRFKNPMQKAEREEFWALRDVSFDVKRGDVVGIIGRNGAGKSTLLKVLSRITEPTSGEAILHGRVGSLLEVGTGFHPELTGRENIYLNGAILGMARSEITRQFDAIVDFSGTEKFLDTPVKRYSSGMYVRLAFAVAAHLNPEILIVDEVLAVGDAEFQKKCLGKMKDVADSGRTILFVSHNMAAVTNLCNSCIVLQGGKLSYHGDTATGLQRYTEMGNPQIESERGDINTHRPSWAKPYITSVRTVDINGEDQFCFPLGSDIGFEMQFVAPPQNPLHSPVMGVVINHATQGTVSGVNMRMTNFEVEPGEYQRGTMRCTLPHLPYLQGRYTADIWLGDGMADVDVVNGYAAFDIEDADVYNSGKVPFSHLGVVFLEPNWSFEADPILNNPATI